MESSGHQDLSIRGYTIAGAKKKLETELASGELGEGEEGTGAAEEPAESPAPRTAKRKAAEPAPAPPTLDSNEAEQIKTLRSGIEKALREAREILALLDSKSP